MRQIKLSILFYKTHAILPQAFMLHCSLTKLPHSIISMDGLALSVLFSKQRAGTSYKSELKNPTCMRVLCLHASELIFITWINFNFVFSALLGQFK